MRGGREGKLIRVRSGASGRGRGAASGGCAQSEKMTAPPTAMAKCSAAEPARDAKRPPKMSTQSAAPKPAPRKEKSCLERSVYMVSATVTEAVRASAWRGGRWGAAASEVGAAAGLGAEVSDLEDDKAEPTALVDGTDRADARGDGKLRIQSGDGVMGLAGVCVPRATLQPGAHREAREAVEVLGVQILVEVASKQEAERGNEADQLQSWRVDHECLHRCAIPAGCR